jgi:hypothetical protein
LKRLKIFLFFQDNKPLSSIQMVYREESKEEEKLAKLNGGFYSY